MTTGDIALLIVMIVVLPVCAIAAFLGWRAVRRAWP
jgi:hypothetical protein